MSIKTMFHGSEEDAGRIADQLKTGGCSSAFRCRGDVGFEVRVNIGHAERAAGIMKGEKPRPAVVVVNPVVVKQVGLFG